MALTKAEKVARFIAQHRTRVAELSVEALDAIIERGGYLPGRERAQELKDLISEVTKDEETRYESLLAQGVYEQLCAIQGIRSVDVDLDSESIVIELHAFYPHEGKIYDFGRWEITIPIPDRNDAYDLDVACDDGTFFYSDDELMFKCYLKNEIRDDRSHPLYAAGPDNDEFCFGELASDINDYIIVSDFVPAIQLISLCLHHVNDDDKFDPDDFDIATGVDIQDLAEFFNLTEDEIKAFEKEADAPGEIGENLDG